MLKLKICKIKVTLHLIKNTYQRSPSSLRRELLELLKETCPLLVWCKILAVQQAWSSFFAGLFSFMMHQMFSAGETSALHALLYADSSKMKSRCCHGYSMLFISVLETSKAFPEKQKSFPNESIWCSETCIYLFFDGAFPEV